MSGENTFLEKIEGMLNSAAKKHLAENSDIDREEIHPNLVDLQRLSPEDSDVDNFGVTVRTEHITYDRDIKPDHLHVESWKGRVSIHTAEEASADCELQSSLDMTPQHAFAMARALAAAAGFSQIDQNSDVVLRNGLAENGGESRE